MQRKIYLSTLLLVALLFTGCLNRKGSIPCYLDPSQPLEERVEDALHRMTLEEKIALIHAQSKFSSPGVARLGIPELWCTDGPHGIRPEVKWDEWNQAGWSNDSCVAFPALTCLAATWNREMAALYGRSIGEEARYREKDVLLGPGVNICRTPLCGRNFEYMGEDPCLASEMVVPYVQGVQQNGVAACVKHFALNNEESHRHTIDVDLDDRALYEIYLPAFRAAVQEGGAWSLMGSYNRYRGQHACHNDRLLNEILKQEWGFDGAVISDWGGVHNTREAIHNGLDLEFGSMTDGLRSGTKNAYDNYFMASPYYAMIRSGECGTEELDDKVRRVLRLNFRTAMNDQKSFGTLCSEEHYAAARRIAQEGIVLLRNEEKVLPLEPSALKRVVVVGENAVKAMTVGGGSSSLKVQREISPLEGIRNHLGEEVEVTWLRGYVGSTDNNYNGVVSGQDLSEERSEEELIEEACLAAREADAVIFVGGLNKSGGQDCEGTDRRALELSYAQNRLIEALVEANPRLVVALVSGSPVAMPWVERVPAIVEAWYLGSEAGPALASVLFGDVNPSGKLPFTFPRQLSDSPAHQPGMGFPNNGPTRYEEGIFVGYRWFDEQGIEPLFPFGHGLSYTTFAYSEALINRSMVRSGGRLRCSVVVTNTGDRAGAEVVQLYLSDRASSLPRPKQELKDFQKIFLNPGESRRVEFEITEAMLSYFDSDRHAWVAEPGDFEARIGASSRDIRATLPFTLR